jgi:hypothetical protein
VPFFRALSAVFHCVPRIILAGEERPSAVSFQIHLGEPPCNLRTANPGTGCIKDLVKGHAFSRAEKAHKKRDFSP